MSVQYAVPAQPVIQYDGTNATEITDAWVAVGVPAGANVQIISASEDGGVLTVEAEAYGGPSNGGWAGTVVVATDDWVILNAGTPVVVPNVDFTERWILQA